MIHPDHRVTFEAYLSRPDLVGPAVASQVPIRHRDGSWVDTVVLVSRWPRDPDRDGLAVVLRPVEGSVDGALDRERAANERLHLIDEMKHRLLEAVSHELRTPLTIIGGFAQTLQREGLTFTSERLAEVGASIERQSARLQRIVSDLMDLDGAPVGIRPGIAIPMEDTYCVRMVRGEVGNLIVDTSREPAVANLPATAAGLACYATAIRNVVTRAPSEAFIGRSEPALDLRPLVYPPAPCRAASSVTSSSTSRRCAGRRSTGCSTWARSSRSWDASSRSWPSPTRCSCSPARP